MKNKHTKTVVEYEKDFVKYEHTFPMVLGPEQIAQRMVIELHVASSAMIRHYYV